MSWLVAVIYVSRLRRRCFLKNVTRRPNKTQSLGVTRRHFFLQPASSATGHSSVKRTPHCSITAQPPPINVPPTLTLPFLQRCETVVCCVTGVAQWKQSHGNVSTTLWGPKSPRHVCRVLEFWVWGISQGPALAWGLEPTLVLALVPWCWKRGAAPTERIWGQTLCRTHQEQWCSIRSLTRSEEHLLFGTVCSFSFQ